MKVVFTWLFILTVAIGFVIVDQQPSQKEVVYDELASGTIEMYCEHSAKVATAQDELRKAKATHERLNKQFGPDAHQTQVAEEMIRVNRMVVGVSLEVKEAIQVRLNELKLEEPSCDD